jgi:hypothetical protein
MNTFVRVVNRCLIQRDTTSTIASTIAIPLRKINAIRVRDNELYVEIPGTSGAMLFGVGCTDQRSMTFSLSNEDEAQKIFDQVITEIS